LVRILLRKDAVSDLRLVSYLAPSLPEGLFVAVATRIAEATGLTTSLRFETRSSAPPRGEVDPFSSGEADIGFLCSPGYVWMTDLQPPAVRLLAAAPVFDDPRTEGRPVYFSDVVVAHGSPAIGFEDLRGGTWAFNDPCSWSGYLNLLVRLRDVGGAAFFRALRESGSHLQSVRLIATGEVDGAAVDSNALAVLRRREPSLASRLRILESWGPHPIQPIVVSSRMPSALADRIAASLCSMHLDEHSARVLRSFGVLRFAPVADEEYAGERAALRSWQPGQQAAGLSTKPTPVCGDLSARGE
jgi:phosphonate transport system substrate-binding protein